MQNDMIPVVLKRRAELARPSSVTKIGFVCGAIVLAWPLTFRLEGIKLLV